MNIHSAVVPTNLFQESFQEEKKEEKEIEIEKQEVTRSTQRWWSERSLG
jgi:ABC-type thiamine transport system substrate-binding protein